jgi:hypothetical protein
LFASFCKIEWQELGKTERVQEFLAVQPLGDGKPFEEVDGIKIWHPNFKGIVTESVNKIFLEALVKKVRDNERVSHCVWRGYEYLPIIKIQALCKTI